MVLFVQVGVATRVSIVPSRMASTDWPLPMPAPISKSKPRAEGCWECQTRGFGLAT